MAADHERAVEQLVAAMQRRRVPAPISHKPVIPSRERRSTTDIRTMTQIEPDSASPTPTLFVCSRRERDGCLIDWGAVTNAEFTLIWQNPSKAFEVLKC